GTGVMFFVPHLDDLAGHNVVIVGGGDSAFDWALSLSPIAKSVTLIHRRGKLRANEAAGGRGDELAPGIVGKAGGARAAAEGPGVVGEDRWTGGVVHPRGTEPRELPADTVVAALGFTADLGPLAQWGMELDKRHILVDSRMATNLSRIFAAGDITEYPGKV